MGCGGVACLIIVSTPGLDFAKGGVQKKTKKKVVILLQPPSIYLPTPIGVQKATFLIFFQYFEMMF